MKNRVKAIIKSPSEYRPKTKLYALIYSAVIMLIRIIYILLKIICKIPRWSFIIIMGTVKYVSILLSLFAINTALMHVYDERPFKFERYRTTAEFKQAVMDRFPVGIDARDAIRVLEASGAECDAFSPTSRSYGEEEDYNMYSGCLYYPSMLTLYGLSYYKVSLYAKDYILTSRYIYFGPRIEAP